MPKQGKEGKKGKKHLPNTAVPVASPYFKSVISNTSSKTMHSVVQLHQLSPIFRLCAKSFNQESLHLAKGLLGQLIVHKSNGMRLSGFVVETECYLGNDDVASHSYQGKRTPRNEAMFMKPGTSYVYSIYGMYHCFNISSKEDGSCVLIRALQPFENSEMMKELRRAKKNSPKKLNFKDLCNGPSKLCLSLNITKESCNKIDLAASDSFWVEKGSIIPQNMVVTTKRVGIESAGLEWANKPLRFYILDNPCVSVKDKYAEQQLREQFSLQLNDPT